MEMTNIPEGKQGNLSRISNFQVYMENCSLILWYSRLSGIFKSNFYGSIKGETAMNKTWVLLLATIVVAGCAMKTKQPTATGQLSILNGPTTVASATGLSKKIGALASTGGDYRLSPSKMTITITGVGFFPVGGNPGNAAISAVSGCTATYDRSKGSLATLNASGITVQTGTFGGVVIRYSNTYAVVINDTASGIYSDPTSPGKLVATQPSGGAQPIQVTDQNAGSEDGQSFICFASPVTIGIDSIPQVYVVFDPTHWLMTTYSNGSFSTPRMSGNPPISPSISKFGKAAFYSNIGTAMAYPWGVGAGGNVSLLFLYSDTATPVSVTWQDQAVCSSSSDMNWVVTFNGNGTSFGTYGMLGLDANHTLAWASPGGVSADRASITGYNGVFRMPEISTVGQTTVLSYLCTSTIPQPVSGPNYSSGAPDFVPAGTLTLTLLED